MATLDLDTVTPEGEFGVENKIGRNYRPGGSDFTIENARRWAISGFLDTGFDHHEMPHITDTKIEFRTGSSTTLTRDEMLTIMDAEFTLGGVTYVFATIEAYNEERHYAYEESSSWTSGLELTFTAKA